MHREINHRKPQFENDSFLIAHMVTRTTDDCYNNKKQLLFKVNELKEFR